MAKPSLLIISSAKCLGGGEIYLKNLLPLLNERYQVMVLGPRFAKKFFASDTRTAWLPLFPKSLDKILRRTHQLKRIYYRLLFKFCYKIDRYNLINVHWFDGALIESISKRPLMLTLQTGFLIPRQYDTYVTNVLNGLDKIICVSQHAKSQVVERGVQADRCVVIYNSIDPKPFVLNKHPGQYITWIGRVEEADKNPALFVDVAKEALKLNLPYRFRMVGNGSYLAKIKRNCPNNLELAGAKTPDQMPEVYRQARLLCMTSTSEGLPFVALEAMASGVPVVATAVGGLVELLSGDAGKLVNSFDPKHLLVAIQSLVEDGKSYERIQVNARQKIEKHFSITSMVNQTLAIYDELIQEKGN